MEQPPTGGYSGGYGNYGGQGMGPGGFYQKPSNGVLILVLGVLSFAICGLLGPVAWVMGNTSLREIRAGIMDPRDEGLVNAGRIIGIIVTCLICLGVLVYCGIFAFVGLAAVGGSAGGGR